MSNDKIALKLKTQKLNRPKMKKRCFKIIVEILSRNEKNVEIGEK